MTFTIIGLGNPVREYDGTRHNIGAMTVSHIAKTLKADEFIFDKKLNALIASVRIGKKDADLVLPQTYMNNSGDCVRKIITNIKKAQNLVVIYDDFNLPLGSMRISYNRSAGGHNGLASIIKSIKTQSFIRIRIGVSPANAKGVARIPHGDDKIEKFILGKIKDADMKELKKIFKRAGGAIETIVQEGREKAMSIYNAG